MSVREATEPVRTSAISWSRAGRAGRRLGELGLHWVVFVVCVLLWQWAAGSAHNPFFPTPLRIAQAARDVWLSGPASHLFLSTAALDNIGPSIGRLLLGWAVAAVLGIVIGIGLGRSRTAMDYAGPTLNFLRAIPPPTVVPVYLVLLDIGTELQLATIITGVIWPVLLNTVDGARSVDRVKIDTSRVFRITRARWLWSVVLPTALPKILAGLRVSLSLSLILMVVSELLGSTNGIGFELHYFQESFDLPDMWACIVLLGLLGYLFNRVLLWVERRALAWDHDSIRR